MTQRQVQIQKQLQHVSDMWHRVMFALELFEHAAGEVGTYPAHYSMQQILLGLDNEQLVKQAAERFSDRNLIRRDEDIQFYLRAFCRGRKNKGFDGSEAAPALLKDFLEWLASRRSIKWTRVDDYIACLLKAILGESYENVIAAMPQPIEEPASASEDGKFSMQDLVQTMGVAGALIDRREARFDNDDDARVEWYSHRRGHFLQGLERLAVGVCQNKVSVGEFGPLFTDVIECLIRSEQQPMDRARLT